MQHKRAIIVSIFICLAVIILVLCVFTLGTQRNSFVKKMNIKVRFDDVNGLQGGNNVWFSGVKIGIVSKVLLKGVNSVEVTLNIDKKQQKFIHSDAQVKISSDGFIGNKIVVIFGGTDSAAIVEENGFLRAEKVVSTEDMIATLQLNNKNLLAITANIKTITDKIVDGQGVAGMLITDASLAKSVRFAISNFRATAANSNKIAQNLLAFSGNINDSNGSLHGLVTDTIIFKNVSQVAMNLKGLTDTAAIFLNALKTMGNNISLASNHLNNTNNTVGLLLNSDSVANAVQGIIKNLNESTVKLNEDLEALQHNFLLRGYFRKKKKMLKH